MGRILVVSLEPLCTCTLPATAPIRRTNIFWALLFQMLKIHACSWVHNKPVVKAEPFWDKCLRKSRLLSHTFMQSTRAYTCLMASCGICVVSVSSQILSSLFQLKRVKKILHLSVTSTDFVSQPLAIRSETDTECLCVHLKWIPAMPVGLQKQSGTHQIEITGTQRRADIYAANVFMQELKTNRE